MSIEVKNITKRFGQFVALNNLSLTFATGELTALLGPSGCGKTTLLRTIAGLEAQDTGQILLEGEDASGRHVRERQVGFVFQHYALFKHMSVFENIAFGLRVKPRHLRPSESQIREKVTQLLELVQLDWLANRFPAQLSGGQRQRIALARALAVEPAVLLLDEPFGALDAKVRKELRRWLRRLHDDLHVTSIFVTHDQDEALEVADQIVIMHKGKVEQIGTAADVYNHPASPFVYGFLGEVNCIQGQIKDGLFQVGKTIFATQQHADLSNGSGVAYVRPHELEIQRYPSKDSGSNKNNAGDKGILTRFRRAHVIGPLAQLELEREDNGDLFEAMIPNESFAALALKEGEMVLNLTEVANVLCTSQPGVSRQIRELEEELGVDIFERSGKRLTGLTEPGRGIMGIVEQLLLQAENLRQASREYAGETSGTLTIATTHTQARYALPKVVQSFRQTFPDVRIALQQSSPEHIAEWVLSGKADIGVATEGLSQFEQLVSFPCYQWHHAVVVPQGHPLLEKNPITLNDLAAFPLITYDVGFTGRGHIDDAFKQAGLPTDIILTAMDSDVIQQYVALGLGVGIVASMALEGNHNNHLQTISSVHLFAPNITRLAVRRGAYLRSYTYEFIMQFAPALTRQAIQAALQNEADL